MGSLVSNHIHYDSDDLGGSSYQIVFTKTEMLSKLLGAWQKRSKGDPQGGFSDAEYSDLDMNLYQLEEEDRAKLRSFSVRKFLEVMEGHEEVVKFMEKIDHVLIFARNVLRSILARCLPMDLPYPALRNILSHLLKEKGLHKVGFIGSDDEVKRVDERINLSFLDDYITFFYHFMKKLMFNSSLTVPLSTMAMRDMIERLMAMRDMIERFEEHLDELKVLAEKVDSGEKVEQIVTSEECEEWESKP